MSMTRQTSTLEGATLPIAAILAAALFWGLNATASKELFAIGASAHFDGVALFVARSAWCFPIFLGLAIWKRPRHKTPLRRSDALRFLFSGLCYGPGTTGAYALGVAATSGAHAALLFSLGPAITGVLSAIVLHERVAPIRIVALGFGLSGAMLLTFTRSATGSTIGGDALIATMVTCLAIQTILARELVRRYDPFFVTGCYGVLGTTILVATGFIAGRGQAILWPLAPDPATIWWFFGEIVLGLSIVAQVAWSWALPRLGPTLTSLIGLYGSVLVGVAGALIVLHETIAPIGYVAAALLVVALGLAVIPARPPAAAPARAVRSAERA